jgi:hypothetical protein
MRDSRALANLKNFKSYQTWEQEAFFRSGFLVILGIPMLAPLLSLANILFKRSAPDVRTWALLNIAALSVYLMISAGLMLFAFMRFLVWRRAHPWTPPSRTHFVG